MANPVVRVILSAVDQVSGVAKKAGDGIDSFASRASGMFKGLAALAVGSALGKFFQESVKEAAGAELQMGRLGTAVTNTRQDFGKLKPQLEETVKSVQRVSTATDDDLREALTRMIAVSGDTQGSMKNLGLVADLAAYKNIGLAEAGDIVAKAMNGNTTALNKMGIAGKDANAVLENARATFGGFAENQAQTFSGQLQQITNQWGEFKEAVGVAILSNGEMGAGAGMLADALAGLAGWVERNEAAIGMVVGKVIDLGRSLFDVAKTIYDAVAPALGPLLKGLFGALLIMVDGASFSVRMLGAMWMKTAGGILDALGTVVEKGGKLLKVFGVSVVQESGASLRAFGERMVTTAEASVDNAKQIFAAGVRDTLRGRKEGNDQAEGEETRHQRTVTAIHRVGTEERLTKSQLAMQIHVENMRRANEIFEDTTKKLSELAVPQLQQISKGWDTIADDVKKAQNYMVITGGEQKFLAEGAKLVAARQRDVSDEAKRTLDKYRDQVDTSRSLGDSFIGIAESAGLLDDKAASTLRSVLQMGTDLAKFGFTSPQGILAVVSGLAQLISGWGSSAAEQARKDAIAKNTQAIEALSRDLSEYNLGVTGEDFAAVTETLGSVVDPPDYLKNMPGFVPEDPLKVLRRAGLESQARKLAEKYGIDVEKDPGGWAKLFEILKSRRFGSAEGNFADELSSLESSFDVLGVDDADDQFAQFAAFAKKHIPALAIPLALADTSTASGRSALISQLKDLYGKSLRSELLPSEYGKSSAPQFRQVVAALLRILGSADGLPSSGAPTAGAGTAGTSGSFAGRFGDVLAGGTAGVGGLPNLGVAGGIPDLPTLSTGPGSIGFGGGSGTSIRIDQANWTFQFPNVRGADDAEALYEKIMAIAQRDLERVRDAQGNVIREDS